MLMNKIVKNTLLAFVVCAVSSCAHNYTVTTNLDKQNFTDYFSPNEVKIYLDESEFNGRYKSLGLVEGESCQLQQHHAKPNELDARTLARKRAYEQQANAIIFSGCATIDSKVCAEQLVCYGHMYQVENAKNDIATKE